ncbi:transglutaminase [Labedella phragmitis]|uniref:Transglutaminase n=1 Tax=Labedella phragmitis TaxID=2498849 RepID=A0A444PQ90_9MICO|nr:transglutaminase domain-containing protein [Labedella phragmitis]RWZ46594.1 transglutaminase [Labedella phragmitis]
MPATVSSTLEFRLAAPSDVILSIAVAAGTPIQHESLMVFGNGLQHPVHEVVDRHGSRLHRFSAPAGSYRVDYAAAVLGQRPPSPTTEMDLIEYLRPSRYSESDEVYGFAKQTFGHLSGGHLIDAISSWVADSFSYVSGSTTGTDSASTTLATRQGVCRDYAHTVVALLRARDIPARIASVYAPGVSPMDFHAVAEAWIEGRWFVIDATRLAPRPSFVRIATGRDAADVAFLTNHFGALTLDSVIVSAVADVLPFDDYRSPLSIG